MAVYTDKFGPFNQAGGAQTIALGQYSRTYNGLSVSVAFRNASGDIVTPAAGTLTLEGKRVGSGIFEPLDVPDIPVATQGGWKQIYTPLESIRITPASIDAALTYTITTCSYGDND